MEIILDFESGSYSKSVLATKHGVPKSSLTRILHDKEKLRTAFETSRFGPQRKRLRHGDHEGLEKCLVLWLRRARSQNIPVNGPLIRAKAEEFVLQLGFLSDQASDLEDLPESDCEDVLERQEVIEQCALRDIPLDFDKYMHIDSGVATCPDNTVQGIVEEVCGEEEDELEEDSDEECTAVVTTLQGAESALRPLRRDGAGKGKRVPAAPLGQQPQQISW
ncbi:hypothetical protein HPB52_012008 [Rhipicephalus sanguineus]|uniref:HTH CENPB-type domain-containing protein n=1 Tax=Rhipicephalus sanguineus TaxID=34632 RepID=A0A9D4SUC6_RHISA|nr:hypothetical protein HPB52_012008 [Rhipicephalus sanguineus]